MKRFYCDCKNELFFENRYCESCQKVVGFDIESFDMVTLNTIDHEVLEASDGRMFRRCDNWISHNVCNWLIPHGNDHSLCEGCQLNRTVPNQMIVDISPPINYLRWLRLEEAKKRLIFTLRGLGLPFVSGWVDPQQGILFDFLEPLQCGGGELSDIVTTGYAGGLVTINSVEADDVARVSAKAALNERQRTILGHFRHETGHYFWDKVFRESSSYADFERIFGDPSASYQESLSSYYQNGPPEGWNEDFISAYASAHPSEDWAETWNHYLLIHDGLETAFEIGLTPLSPRYLDIKDTLIAWRKFAIEINHVNRSIGLHDAYPYVISKSVEEKMAYVDSLVVKISKV